MNTDPSPEELAIVRKPDEFDHERPQRKISYLPDAHKLLPAASDAEEAFISSMLINPASVCAMAVQKKMTPDHFHLPAHQEIYRVLMRMWEEKRPIDLITVCDELRDRQLLAQVGGPAFISRLTDFPTAANATSYLEIAHEKRVSREIIKRLSETVTRAYNEGPTELLDKVQTDAIELAKLLQTGQQQETMEDLVKQAIARVEQREKEGTGMVGLSTGLTDLDEKIGGIVRGEYIVIQGARSDGKTSLALTMLHHQAVTLGQPCGMTSLDMPRLDIVDRLICMEADVCLEEFRRGRLSEFDFEKVAKAAARVARAPIFIDDRTGQGINEIRAAALLMAQERGVVLWILDYIQKVKCRKTGQEKRYEQIAGVSSDLKDLGRDANFAMLILSQINADGEVASSKEIIDHADTVLAPCNHEEASGIEGDFSIRVNKQRNGSRNHDVPVRFDKKRVIFRGGAAETPALIQMPAVKKSKKR